MSKTVWILGASDPEMSAIESLLAANGEAFAYAAADGGRVHPGNAYAAVSLLWPASAATSPGEPASVASVVETSHAVLVECGFPALDVTNPFLARVDHHRPGDAGFGRPPEEFLPASSVGQVFAHLHGLGDEGGWSLVTAEDAAATGCEPGWWYVAEGVDPDGHAFSQTHPVPPAVVLAAAADHCLAAAYAGRCPGVDPDELAGWQLASRAAFQRRPEAELLADFARARVALAEAPKLDLAAKAAAVESPVPHCSRVSDSEFYWLVQHEAPGGWTERSSAFRCEECARRWAGLHAQGPGGWHVESRPLSEAPRFPDLFTDWEGRYPSPLCERRP